MTKVILFGFSPLVALILNLIFHRRLPTIAVATILFICFIIASPLLFTNYYYSDLFEGFYSAYLIKAIILSALLFIVLNISQNNRALKAIVLTVACLITLGYMSLTLFARGFVGDGKIYSTQRINGYRIIYRREADAVLTGATRIDLYKLAVFGLLQKNIDFAYPDNNDKSCRAILNDSLNSKNFVFNFCENKINAE